LGKGSYRLVQTKKQTYLLLVDYYSLYPEVIKFNSTTSANVIAAMKSVFSRHGISQTVISDNGPQYDSTEMKQFALHMDLTILLQVHITLKAMAWLNVW